MGIVIPAVERRDVGWGDLDLLLHSLQLYDPYAYPIYIAFKGNRDSLQSMCERYPAVVKIGEQPPTANNFGKACEFALSLVDEDIKEVLLLNDDTVAVPTTISFLHNDIIVLENMHPHNIGMIGCRSNALDGPQFVGSDLQWYDREEMPHKPGYRVVMVAVWFTLDALNAVPKDWMKLHWGSDTLFTYDLHRAGYVNYTGTFYFHHHGSRASLESFEHGDARDKGNAARAWIRANRPDFYDFYAGVPRLTKLKPSQMGNPYGS